jgi:hypothetical protein
VQPGDFDAGARPGVGEDVAGVVAVLERVGVQEPRIMAIPKSKSSLGQEAVELSASAGLILDEWQALVLEHALGVRKDGKWAAFEVGVNVARQNGKGGILEARELAGLFLFEERLQIHSAHQFDTSLEAFRRLKWLIEDTPELDCQVRRWSHSHGEEGLELKNGNRIRFRTRTKGGGRGFSGDTLYLDEAMFLSTHSHGALLPVLSARPNSQVWYTGSAVDQLIHPDGVVFAKVRERGLAGDDPALAYFEWSADFHSPDELEETDAQDEVNWLAANPGLGIRIAAEHVAYEQRSMDNRTFAVERLGVGDWPQTEGFETIIDLDVWDGLADSASRLVGEPVFAFDVSPSRVSASISAGGLRGDGLLHPETVQHGRGTGWVVPRLVELVEKHGATKVVCDGVGPAAALIPELEKKGIVVEALSAQEYARACGTFFDAVEQRGLRHLGTAELRSAIKGAATRPLGDAWAWSRKNSGVDITPLVSATIALFAAASLASGYLMMLEDDE